MSRTATRALAKALLGCVEHPYRTLVALAALIGGVLAVLPMRHDTFTPRRSPNLVTARTSPQPVGGLAEWIAADDDHVYWSYSNVREYDDEAIRISAAQVLRRAHAGGEPELVFEFQRDDTYCLPGRLHALDGPIGWFCDSAYLESNERSDAPRFMHRRGGALHAAMTPPARDEEITTSGRAIYLIERDRRSAHVLRIDAVSGERARIADLSSLGNSPLHGVAADRLIGELRADQRVQLWSMPIVGGTPHVFWRAPERMFVNSVVVAGERVLVAWGIYPTSVLTAIEGDRARDLLRLEMPIRSLHVRGEDVYFESENRIHRYALANGSVTTVAEPAPDEGNVASIAVGGGYVYWIQRPRRTGWRGVIYRAPLSE